MASPSIRSSAVTNGTSATATPSINLPATVRAGDTLVIYFKNAVAGAIGWPDATWQEMVDASPDASVGQIGIAYKKAVGTEGGTTVSLTSGNGKFAAISRAISGATDPLIRAPEISTVATGSGTEPNATTVTPTGGSKDYLWDTVYFMEGEQTGITSNPASYTLDQQFANSGTAGAVTTNCTIGAVGRQTTAASEDAGVWDVTGTLDDWSAYTLAFHPAAAIPAPLAPENFYPELPDPKRAAPLFVLTIAVNLLQSTLAPLPPGKIHTENPPPLLKRETVQWIQQRPQYYQDAKIDRQWDWPVPQQRRQPTETWTQNLLETTLSIQSLPFNQYDWPNPPSYRPTLHITNDVGMPEDSDIPEAQYDWLPPVGRTPPNVGFTANVFIQGISEQAPFRQTEWPNPPTKPYLLTWTEGSPPEEVSLPAGTVVAWPNPALRPRPALTWTQSLNTTTLSAAPTPVVPNDFQNPRRVVQPTLTWTQNRPQFYQDPIPAGAQTFEVPAPARKLALTWVQTRPIFAVDNSPFNQYDWPIPLRPRVLAITWLQARPQFYVDQPLAGAQEFTLPLRKALPTLVWTSSTLALGEPFRQTDWPLPLRKAPQTLSWIQTRPVFAVDTQPFAQYDWPLPRKVAPHTLTWTQARPQFYVDTLTAGAQEYALPTRRVVRETLSWTQWRPLGAVETQPFAQYDWPNPRKIAPHTITWTQDRPQFYQDPLPVGAQTFALPLVGGRQTLTWSTSTLALGEPFRQTNWPLPLRATVPALSWIQTRPIFAEDTQPFAQYDWPLPLKGAPQTLVWTQTRPQFYEDQFPVGAQAFELPAPARRLALTWTSTIPSTETPFAQTDWPLPRRPIAPALTWTQSRSIVLSDQFPTGSQSTALPLPLKRQPTLSWIQPRPFFYAEPGDPPPGDQYARDLPLVGGRNPVGFIVSRPQFYQDPRPTGATEQTLPKLRPAPALTWIQEAIKQAASPVTTSVTFVPRAGRVRVETWISGTLALGEPVRPVLWDVPARRAPQTLSWIQVARLLENPVRSVDLPLPPRRVAGHVGFTQSSLDIATIRPVTPPLWDVPARPAPQTLTWTSERAQVLEDQPLAGVQSFELPIYPVERETMSHVQRALGLGLAQAVPTAQYDWPIPLRPNVLALTWTNPGLGIQELVSTPIGLLVIRDEDLRASHASGESIRQPLGFGCVLRYSAADGTLRSAKATGDTLTKVGPTDETIITS